MAPGTAEKLIRAATPSDALLVDIGRGSVITAKWAVEEGREFLAVEPNADAHARGRTEIERGTQNQAPV
jgi:predicted Rossmann fold nucleotide-binding protein DprA/Smf involved in DNA uptake